MLRISFQSGGRAKEQVEMVAGPRNHLNLRWQDPRTGGAQVRIKSPSRNQLYRLRSEAPKGGGGRRPFRANPPAAIRSGDLKAAAGAPCPGSAFARDRRSGAEVALASHGTML